MVTIDRLWNSRDQAEWCAALENYHCYIKSSTVARLDAELDPLDLEIIRRARADGWYRFLHDKYFPWKYTAPNRLATTRSKLTHYKSEGRLRELHGIRKELLATATENVSEGLRIASSIHGLGIAGASGLLALMFPQQFGTVDEFMVLALAKVRGLPEQGKLRELARRIQLSKIRRKSFALRHKDGVMLIEIMRRKAGENNRLFKTKFWTPRKIDKVLWACGHE